MLSEYSLRHDWQEGDFVIWDNTGALHRAIPYDFDYSGLVSVDYAIPSPDLPIKVVQERYYLGFCRSAASYSDRFKEFLAQKEAILAVCQQAPRLEKANRRQMHDLPERVF